MTACSTDRAKSLLRVWAEAMAYGSNSHAPDDQVLDLLYSQGGWSRRASYGWLPSSYMRTMPAYYRGVDPVIDHDHGSAPGDPDPTPNPHADPNPNPNPNLNPNPNATPNPGVCSGSPSRTLASSRAAR